LRVLVDRCRAAEPMVCPETFVRENTLAAVLKPCVTGGRAVTLVAYAPM